MSSGQGGLSRSLAKRVTGHGRLYADDAVTERGTFSFEQTSATKTMLLNLPRLPQQQIALASRKACSKRIQVEDHEDQPQTREGPATSVCSNHDRLVNEHEPYEGEQSEAQACIKENVATERRNEHDRGRTYLRNHAWVVRRHRDLSLKRLV